MAVALRSGPPRSQRQRRLSFALPCHVTHILRALGQRGFAPAFAILLICLGLHRVGTPLRAGRPLLVLVCVPLRLCASKPWSSHQARHRPTDRPLPTSHQPLDRAPPPTGAPRGSPPTPTAGLRGGHGASALIDLPPPPSPRADPTDVPGSLGGDPPGAAPRSLTAMSCPVVLSNACRGSQPPTHKHHEQRASAVCARVRSGTTMAKRRPSGVCATPERHTSGARAGTERRPGGVAMEPPTRRMCGAHAAIERRMFGVGAERPPWDDAPRGRRPHGVNRHVASCHNSTPQPDQPC